MKQRPIVRRFTGLVIAGLSVTGAASAASDALKYYPTSVVPTLPTPHELRWMREDMPRGILAVLQSAYRRSVSQAWSGIPALDRGSLGASTVVPALKPVVEGASPATPVGAKRSALQIQRQAEADE